MTNIFPEPLIWAVGIVVVYGLLSRGLFLATEDARQSLVDRAGALIDNPRFPESEKDAVRSFLNDAHSVRSAWALAFTAVLVLFKYAFLRPKDHPTERSALQKEYNAFTTR